MTDDLLEHLGDYLYTGGTYDRFHLGHIEEIRATFEYAKARNLQVAIFVKGDDLARTKGDVLPYGQRVADLREYLQELGKENTIIIELNEQSFPYWIEYLSSDRRVKATFVKYDASGATAYVNLLRGKMGLFPIDIISVDMIFAQDGRPISSTRIRAGEIDREGNTLCYKVRPKVIGIGGRVGSGKSTVCNHLGSTYDLAVINVDELRPVQEGLEDRTLRLLFGVGLSILREDGGKEILLEQVLTGINRDRSLAGKYNSVYLPGSIDRLKREIIRHSDQDIIVVEWALFGESNGFQCLDHYIHLMIDVEERVRRLKERYSSLRPELLEALINAQLSDDQTIEKAVQSVPMDRINGQRTVQEISDDIIGKIGTRGIYLRERS